jgi:hypothetical protein
MPVKIPYLTTPEAQSLIACLIDGTTSVPDDYKVLWMGEHLALIRWRGHTYRGRWNPATVRLIRIDAAKPWDVDGSVRMQITRQIRLTQTVLDTLIENAAARDAGWVAEMDKKATTSAAAAAAANALRQAETDVKHCRVKLLDAAEALCLEERAGFCDSFPDKALLCYAAAQYKMALAALDALKEQP